MIERHPSGAFAVDIQFTERRVVLGLSGELDLMMVPMLQAVVDELPPAVDHVVFDLDELSFCDTSGIRLFEEAARQRQGWGEVVLAHPSAVVARMCALFELDSLLAA
jgi:anti-sigma B factor antagonist